MAQKKSALPFHERLFALGTVGFFLFVIIFNIWTDEGKLPENVGTPVLLKNPFIEVTIEGKVEKPGVYQVKKGTHVEEVVLQAIPKADANLKRIKLDSQINRRRKITIR